MRVHPEADRFPLMTGDQYAELLADVRDHGQREPIRIWNDMILDGRNRWNVCRELGVDCFMQPFHGNEDDAVNLIVSLNLRRRHLTMDERKRLAADIAARNPQLSQRRIAATLGLGKSTVARVSQAGQPNNPQQSQQDAGPTSTLPEEHAQRSKGSRGDRAKVRALLEKDPNLGVRELARLTGCSAATVSKVRVEMGLPPPPKGPKRKPKPLENSSESVTAEPSVGDGKTDKILESAKLPKSPLQPPSAPEWKSKTHKEVVDDIDRKFEYAMSLPDYALDYLELKWQYRRTLKSQRRAA